MRKIILSGGGTGGHIYPAVAVAQALQHELGERGVELLFVGAESKMEMEKVPALGYRIVGLPVAGLQRRFTIKNLMLPIKTMRSLYLARKIIKDFDADLVAGFGGYASGPVLFQAQRLGIPTIIQEQNSYAGITNKVLGREAKRICVAYQGMEKFFPADKIILTGNPLRSNFSVADDNAREQAMAHYNLDGNRRTILIIGGSLGTRTLNNMMRKAVEDGVFDGDIQVIWQTGRYYQSEIDRFMENRNNKNIWRSAFIERMDLAYAAADVVISRSGASTVSELCLVGKPVIFVPSPNVAEDHQTKNARALADKQAALIVTDVDAINTAIPLAVGLLQNHERMKQMGKNIKALAIADSAQRVARCIIDLIDGN